MKRDRVIKTIQNGVSDPDAFLGLVSQHVAKSDSFDLEEFFQALPRKQHAVVWSAIYQLSQKTVDSIATSLQAEEEVGEGDLRVLEGVVVFTRSALALDPPNTPQELRDTLQLLHDILLSLSEAAPDLQNSISVLCEGWWQRDLPDRDVIIPHSLLYTVARTLADGATVADVHRVWMLRQGLLLLDFDDQSADSLKCMLLSCTLRPLYLRTDEGRKFLCFLFGLHPKFVEDLHQSIKFQIPGCTKGFLEVYGEIYFRAWRLATGPYLKQLEEHCLQDLMYSAVHASRTGPHSLFHSLKTLLGYLHRQHTQKGVSEMLMRLYSPFLWRSLKVANASVRANAVTLLLDAFPLQDPESTREDIDTIMQKQFDAMKDFLDDSAVTVRVSAVMGVCRVLSLYWEMIPVPVITALLNRLMRELAMDAASIDVRVAVMQGLCLVLENRLSHPVMRELLPLLRNHLHDTSEKVRISFLDLLLLVKGMRMIKFWQVCPVEHLLARMEVDSVHIVKRIVALLVDSFQPSNITGAQQIERCIVLLRFNPGAARQFYQQAVTHLSPADVVRFILTINSAVLQCIQEEEEEEEAVKEGSGKQKSSEPIEDTVSGRADSDSGVEDTAGSPSSTSSPDPTGITQGGWKEEGGGERGELESSMEAEAGGEVLSLKDTDLIAGMLETVVILWEGARERLDKPTNRPIKTKLVKKMSESLPVLFDTFKDGPSRSALYLLSSFLPRKAVSSLAQSTLQTLSSISNSQDYTSILMALVAWRQTGSVIKVIHQSLVSGLSMAEPQEEHTKTTNNKKAGKRKKNAVSLQPHPSLALEMVSWMMGHPVCFEQLRGLKEFWQLSELLHSSMDLLEQHFSLPTPPPPSSSSPPFSLLSAALSAYIRLKMHQRSEHSQERFSECLQELLTWCETRVIPYLSATSALTVKVVRRSSRKRKADQPHPPMTSNPSAKEAGIICELVLEQLCEMVTVGLVEEGEDENVIACFAGKLADQCSGGSGPGSGFLPLLCKLLYQLCDGAVKCEVAGIRGSGSLRPAAVLLERMLSLLGRLAGSDDALLTKAWLKLKPCVSNAVTISLRLHALSVSPHSLSVFSTITRKALQEQAEHIRTKPTLTPPASVDELPVLVSHLVKVSCKDETSTSLFASHLYSHLEDTDPAKLPESLLIHNAALTITHALAGKYGEDELVRCMRRSMALTTKLSEEDKERWNGPVSEISGLIELLQEKLFH